MSNFLGTIPLPPKTLTEREQDELLAITGQRRGAFRDHMILSVALGTGLREHEIVALNVGDVTDERGAARRRVALRVFKRSAKRPAPQEVVLPKNLLIKLPKFLDWKRREGQSLEPSAPLFVGRSGKRLSTRQLRHLFRVWQVRAGFDRLYTFHGLRHRSVTNVYRRTRDILQTQRFARHTDVRTTMRYAHADEEELIRVIQDLPC